MNNYLIRGECSLFVALCNYRPDNTVLGGTKLVGNSDESVSKEDHDMIIDFAKTHFPWLNITVSSL